MLLMLCPISLVARPAHDLSFVHVHLFSVWTYVILQNPPLAWVLFFRCFLSVYLIPPIK